MDILFEVLWIQHKNPGPSKNIGYHSDLQFEESHNWTGMIGVAGWKCLGSTRLAAKQLAQVERSAEPAHNL